MALCLAGALIAPHARALEIADGTRAVLEESNTSGDDLNIIKADDLDASLLCGLTIKGDGYYYAANNRGTSVGRSYAQNCYLEVIQGGSIKTGYFYIGRDQNAHNNWAVVDGEGSEVNITNKSNGLRIGAGSSSENYMIIRNGGRVSGGGIVKLGKSGVTAGKNRIEMDNGTLVTYRFQIYAGNDLVMKDSTIEVDGVSTSSNWEENGCLYFEQNELSNYDFSGNNTIALLINPEEFDPNFKLFADIEGINFYDEFSYFCKDDNGDMHPISWDGSGWVVPTHRELVLNNENKTYSSATEVGEGKRYQSILITDGGSLDSSSHIGLVDEGEIVVDNSTLAVNTLTTDVGSTLSFKGDTQLIINSYKIDAEPITLLGDIECSTPPVIELRYDPNDSYFGDIRIFSAETPAATIDKFASSEVRLRSYYTDRTYSLSYVGDGVWTTNSGSIYEDDAIGLTSMNYKSVKVGWGSVGINTRVKNWGPLTGDSIYYEKGIACHADSEVVYEIGGEYAKFRTIIATPNSKSGAAMNMKIYGDDQLLYDSGVMARYDLQEVEVDVTGVQELRLVGEDTKNAGNAFHSWLAPRLLLPGEYYHEFNHNDGSSVTIDDDYNRFGDIIISGDGSELILGDGSLNEVNGQTQVDNNGTITITDGGILNLNDTLWIGSDAGGGTVELEDGRLVVDRVGITEGSSLNLGENQTLEFFPYDRNENPQDWANNSSFLHINGEINLSAGSAIHLIYPNSDSIPLAVNLLHYESSTSAYETLQAAPIYAVDAETGELYELVFNKGFWIRPGFLPEAFELPFKETGKRTVAYMAEDAFSPERLADGEAIYIEKCGACHGHGGADMPMFGAAFNDTRVVSSTKKFSGPLGDPEAGEKVFEFLRYNHPGPFQSFDDSFLQSGPLQKRPGVLNPHLNRSEDFYAAWSGHKYPVIEDVHFDENKYDRTQQFSYKRRLTWNEWIPHFIPPSYSADPIAAHIAENGTGKSSLSDAAKLFKNLYNPFGQASPNYELMAEGNWDYDTLFIAQMSQDNWLRIATYENQLPRWVDGQWDRPGNWNFELGSAMDHDVIYYGTRSAHVDIERNGRRQSAFQRMKHGWWDYNSGISPDRDPATGATSGPWGCWCPTYGKEMEHFHQTVLRYFSVKGTAASYAKDGSKSRDGKASLGYKLHDDEETYLGRRAVLEHSVYYDWKILIGKGDETSLVGCLACDGSGCKYCEDGYLPLGSDWVECGQCGGEGCDHCDGIGYLVSDDTSSGPFSDMYNYTAKFAQDPAEEKFMRAFVQRWARNPLLHGELDRPALLCRGTGHVKVGQEYKLYIMRAMPYDGDVTVWAINMPSGAKLSREPDNIGEYDYFVRWTPTINDIGEHKFRVKAKSDAHYSQHAFQDVTIKVSLDGPTPEIDPFDDHQIVYSGQSFALPLTICSDFREEMEMELVGSVGEIVQNHRKKGGLYWLRAEDKHVGVHQLTFIARSASGLESKRSMTLEVRANSAPSLKLAEQGQGPGGFKNIFRARAGENLVVKTLLSEPDNDEVRINVTYGFPGEYELNEESGTYDFTMEVTDKMAAEFPGPNVLTINAEDEWGVNTPLVLLVYFEPAGSNLNHHPWAVTGSVQYVNSGDKVTLDASASDDPDGDEIYYKWAYSQDAGKPSVSLSSTTSVQPTFTAPSVQEPTTLKFALTVTDKPGDKDENVARVIVYPKGWDLPEIDTPSHGGEPDEDDTIELTDAEFLCYEAEHGIYLGGRLNDMEHASNQQMVYYLSGTDGRLIWMPQIEQAGRYLVVLDYEFDNLSNTKRDGAIYHNDSLLGEFAFNNIQTVPSGSAARQTSIRVGTVTTIQPAAVNPTQQRFIAELSEGTNTFELTMASGHALNIDRLVLVPLPDAEDISYAITIPTSGSQPEVAPMPAGVTFLSDLEMASGSKNGENAFGIDQQNNNTGAIIIAGIEYEKGIGCRANSTMNYQLNGEYSTFVSDFANLSGRTDRSMIVTIYGDGKELFYQESICIVDLVHLNLDVSGVNELSIVTSRSSSTGGAYAAWAGAYLTKNDYAGWVAGQGNVDKPLGLTTPDDLPSGDQISFDKYAFGDHGVHHTLRPDGTWETTHMKRDNVSYTTEYSFDLSSWQAVPQEQLNAQYSSSSAGENMATFTLPPQDEQPKLFIRVHAEEE